VAAAAVTRNPWLDLERRYHRTEGKGRELEGHRRAGSSGTVARGDGEGAEHHHATTTMGRIPADEDKMRETERRRELEEERKEQLK
jgi:hypothetical protein